MPISYEDVNSLETLIEYILEYEDCIYIREKINGKFENVSLKDLPTPLKAKRFAGFLERGVIPVRVKRDDEQGRDVEENRNQERMDAIHGDREV